MGVYGDHVLPRLIDVGCNMKESLKQRSRVCEGLAGDVVGESQTFQGGIEWLRELGVEVIDLDSGGCRELLGGFIASRPEVWNEDIGE